MIKSNTLRWAGLAIALSVSAAAAEPIDFTLENSRGEPVSLSEYRGKWVVVNYWATWCPPCLEEIPELVEFHERRRDDDAVVIGISYEDIPLEQLRAFVDEYFISYPVLRADDMRPAHDKLDVGGLPTTYIINPEGEPVARQIGGITGAVLDEYIEHKQGER